MSFPFFSKPFFMRNRREILFVGKFVLFFLAGQALYSLLSPILSPVLTDLLTASVSAGLINLLSPGQLVTTQGNTLLSAGVSLQIAIGCDGVEGLIIVLAAVGSFPMPLRRKLFGMLAGAAVVYLSNLLRVIGLFFTLKLYPDLFNFMHLFVGQTAIIFVCMVFFLTWVGRPGKQLESNC